MARVQAAEQRNKVNSQIRKAKSDFVLALAPEEQTENSGTGLSDNSQKLNLSRLQQLLAVFKKGKSSFIPTLVDASGNPMESDAEKAEVLNSFVRQASLSALDGVLPNILAAPVTDSQILTELSVSLQDVLRALHGLDARKAPGSDPENINQLIEDATTKGHRLSLMVDDYTNVLAIRRPTSQQTVKVAHWHGNGCHACV